MPCDLSDKTLELSSPNPHYATMKLSTALSLLVCAAPMLASAQFFERNEQLKAPEFVGSTWMNLGDKKPFSLADRKGKVTIVHFWTFACENCQHNLPAYERLLQKYAGKDISWVGIHTPEIEIEKKDENVKEAIAKWKIHFPVLVDKDGTNWKRWKQSMWPTIYVIDKAGYVRFQWQGELGWKGADGEQQVAKAIEKLLKE